MDRIYEYLKEAELSKDYQDIFGTDNLKLKSRISKADSSSIDTTLSHFEQNKLYKLFVCKNYNKTISLSEAYWIINFWGGIASFKETTNNDSKISRFIDKIKNGNLDLTLNEFSTISSLSKISFFFDIDKYCIYDSRVIYSLNWIIYKTQEKEIKYFPMPNGRNKIISNYPVEAIIKFSLLESNNIDFAKYYYTHKEAYKKYNELMAKISLRLFGEQAKPFFAEMLLFGMADKYIYNDIRDDIQIRLKSNSKYKTI